MPLLETERHGTLVCDTCRAYVELAAPDDRVFFDLWPARGWEFDGGADPGWYCPDCAARRRETGRAEVGA